MKIQALLRHVADNLDNDRVAGYGLLYRNRESGRLTADLIEWRNPHNYNLDASKIELPQELEYLVPVAGEECEVYCAYNQGEPDKDMAWRKTTILSIVGAIENEGLVTFETGWSEQWYGETDICNLREFRPVRTEREKVIGAANSAVGAGGYTIEWASVLYDAGMLVMPESKT